MPPCSPRSKKSRVTAIVPEGRRSDTGEGPAEALRRNPDVKEFYLGLNEAGAHRSYHDVKRYRRRKRWLS